MDTFSEAEAFVALLINYYEESDLISWAQSYAQKHPEMDSDSTLFEIARLNRKRKGELSQARQLMERFMADIEPQFDVLSEERQAVAKKLFELRLQKYLDNECTPWEVCRMVQAIEQLYDFPSWLGDMFDACDWIESDTRPVDCRHLEQAIRTHLESARVGSP